MSVVLYLYCDIPVLLQRRRLGVYGQDENHGGAYMCSVGTDTSPNAGDGMAWHMTKHVLVQGGIHITYTKIDQSCIELIFVFEYINAS